MMLLLAEMNLVAVLDDWCPLSTVAVLAGFCGALACAAARYVPALRLHPAAVSLCLAATAGPAAKDCADPPGFGFVALSDSVRPLTAAAAAG